MQVSVVIITYNEEKNIRRCLQSISLITDDIVVVDSFSTDKTEEICKEFNVHFIKREFKGYSEQKNFANKQAKNDFIFSIDADEAISDELAKNIQAITDNLAGDVFWINRKTNYCGKWIRHCGWYPDRKERLWNRHLGQWQGQIHEKPQFPETVRHRWLNGDLLHYSYYNIDEHYRQSEKFAKMKAEEMHALGKTTNVALMIGSPVIRFLSVFIWKLGFLDGYKGFLIAKISARATFCKHSQLLYLRKAINC